MALTQSVVANLTIGFFFMLALMVLVSGTYTGKATGLAVSRTEKRCTEAQSIVAPSRFVNILAMIDDSTGKWNVQ